MVAMFVMEEMRNQSRTFHRCFLPSFCSFRQAITNNDCKIVTISAIKQFNLKTVTDNGQEKFEDAKGVIRSCKLKVDRQFNGQKEKDS
jgi:hypothetical protein